MTGLDWLVIAVVFAVLIVVLGYDVFTRRAVDAEQAERDAARRRLRREARRQP